MYLVTVGAGCSQVHNKHKLRRIANEKIKRIYFPGRGHGADFDNGRMRRSSFSAKHRFEFNWRSKRRVITWKRTGNHCCRAHCGWWASPQGNQETFWGRVSLYYSGTGWNSQCRIQGKNYRPAFSRRGYWYFLGWKSWWICWLYFNGTMLSTGWTYQTGQSWHHQLSFQLW